MKKILLIAMASSLLFGCVSMGTLSPEDIAYRSGRLATLAYVLKSDDPEFKAGIKQAWASFDMVCVSLKQKDASKFKQEVLDCLKLHVKDQKQLAISSELVEVFWTQLGSQVDLSKLSEEDFVRVMLRFHDGIMDAYKQYGNF